MKAACLILLALISVGRPLAFGLAGQDSSKPVPPSFYVGNWVYYINGPTVKEVMHLRVDASGTLSGSIDLPDSKESPKQITDVKMFDRGFSFPWLQGQRAVIGLSDDGKHLLGIGVWERIATAENHPCPKFDAASVRLDPDIQELLDGIKPKSSAEATTIIFCASAADIDVLKEILVYGSVSEIRTLRKAQIAMDKINTLCPPLTETATQKQIKEYGNCEMGIIKAYKTALQALQDKMRSLIPDPNDVATFEPEVKFAQDLVPLIAKQAQVEEKHGTPK
jgi:hypothetical protein